MLSFISNLIGTRTDSAVQGALEALVSWNPEAATEAELLTMEQYLDRLGREVAEARMVFNRERKEADAIRVLSQQRLAAAEHLQRQIATETDAGRKSALEKSLATLVAMLEEMAPDVDREAQDAEHAREFLETLEEAYAQAGAKLKEARGTLQRAGRDMERAAQQREVAERRAEAARRTAGLASATSGLGVALKAMQDNAARNLAAAEAASAKARLLQPSKPEKEDPNIAAAMAAVSGAGPVAPSLAERIAALRAKSGLAAPASR